MNKRSDEIDRSQICVILRTAGERTVGACRASLLEELPGCEIRTVKAVPFTTALRIGFETAIESGRAWTLCVDADMLFLPGAISYLLRFGSKTTSASAFGFYGRVHDKFLGKARRGHHFYRTTYLRRALEFLPEVVDYPRPETEIKRRMDSIGHPWITLDLTVAVHDYHQYFRDIFRKMVVREYRIGEVRSHSDRLAQLGDQDFDFLMAAAGMEHAQKIRATEPISLHADAYHSESRQALEQLGVAEKLPLHGRLETRRLLSELPEYSGLRLQLRKDVNRLHMRHSQTSPIQSLARKLLDRYLRFRLRILS